MMDQFVEVKRQWQECRLLICCFCMGKLLGLEKYSNDIEISYTRRLQNGA